MSVPIPQNIEQWRYVSAGNDFIAVYRNEERVHFVANLDESYSSGTDGPFIVTACQSYGPMLNALYEVLNVLADGADAKKVVLNAIRKAEGK